MGTWIVLLIVVALILVFMLRGGKWQTLSTSNSGSMEEMEAKYAFLQANDVKCKLKTEGGPELGAVSGTGVKAAATLMVHEKDVERARILLDQFEQERRFV